jgi:hypothetical protein
LAFHIRLSFFPGMGSISSSVDPSVVHFNDDGKFHLFESGNG